ncbi:MAG: carboxylating nicotinate-nucleotide diphosphorylase [Elusimicrobiota bacterium]
MDGSYKFRNFEGSPRPDFSGLARAALREDRALQDVTSRAFLPPGARARARVKARSAGVVCGGEAAALAFRLLDPRCRARLLAPDGRAVRAGQAVLEVRGPLASILSAERTALNILTHLSGVATLTRRFARAAGPRAKILDTRKTLPGLRAAQKWAVLCGGGRSHRADLASAVLIKENHLAAVRGEKDLARLFRKVRAFRRRRVPVEMECQNRRHILWGLLAGADILLLDNFSARDLRRAVRFIRRFCAERRLPRPLLEASGGISLANVKAVARAGVDRISIGALTHSAPALDMGLDVEIEGRKA